MKTGQQTGQRKGQSLVEFAIMLPLLMLLLVGIIQFGIIIAHYLTLNHAAVVGARTASVALAANAESEGEAAALKAVSTFIKNAGDLTVSITNITVDTESEPGVPAVSVTCTYNLSLIFPNFFAPDPLSLSATAIMRKE